MSHSKKENYSVIVSTDVPFRELERETLDCSPLSSKVGVWVGERAFYLDERQVRELSPLHTVEDLRAIRARFGNVWLLEEQQVALPSYSAFAVVLEQGEEPPCVVIVDQVKEQLSEKEAQRFACLLRAIREEGRRV